MVLPRDTRGPTIFVKAHFLGTLSHPYIRPILCTDMLTILAHERRTN